MNQHSVTNQDWLSAQKIEEHFDYRYNVALWKEEGRIFSIINDLKIELYPLYGFDDKGQPLSIMEDILTVFESHKPIVVAAWFESLNSKLENQRPRDLLRTDPQLVLLTAREDASGILHT